MNKEMVKRIGSLLTLLVLVLTECFTPMSYVLAENDAEQDFQIEENVIQEEDIGDSLSDREEETQNDDNEEENIQESSDDVLEGQEDKEDEEQDVQKSLVDTQDDKNEEENGNLGTEIEDNGESEEGDNTQNSSTEILETQTGSEVDTLNGQENNNQENGGKNNQENGENNIQDNEEQNTQDSSVETPEIQTGTQTGRGVDTGINIPQGQEEEKEGGVIETITEEIQEIITKIRYFFKREGDSRYIKYGRDSNNIGTITLKDPKTSASITIMDKNLGAESVGVGRSSYGNYFQWGNNSGVKTVNGSNKTTEKAIYKDSYYNRGYDGKGMFIVGGRDYWENGDHYNSLWGNESKESSRYGSCPVGYHIPTVKEWNQLLSIWGKIHTQDTTKNEIVLRYSADYATKNIHTFKGAATQCAQGENECVDEDKLSIIIETLSEELKLPLAGSYDENGNYEEGLGVYWTTVAKDGNKAGVFDMNVYIGNGVDERLQYKSQGHNIRCFQNIYPYEAPVEIEDQDGEVGSGENKIEVGSGESIVEENTQNGENQGLQENDVYTTGLQEDNVYTTGVQMYTITWKNEDGTIRDATQVAYGEMPTHEDITQPADEKYTYTFAGWEPEIRVVDGDAEYKAKYIYTANKSTITWKNEDGTIIDTTEVLYGEMPTHEDAYQPADEKYTYVFKGWEPEISNMVGPAEYMATYEYILNTYTVTWENEDGSILEEDKDVEYGTIPTYDGENPVKQGDGNVEYIFSGWETDISEVTGDVVYVARYDVVEISEDNGSGSDVVESNDSQEDDGNGDNILSGMEGNVDGGEGSGDEIIEIEDSLDETSEGEEQGFFEGLWETIKSFFLNDEDGYLRGSETINDIVVSVEAEAGTFPEGTEVVIKGVSDERLESIQTSLVEDETNNVTEDAQILAFDISFIYSGEEIQPEKEVSVKFNYKENIDFQGSSMSELSVYHIDDETDEGQEVEVVNKEGDEIEILATDFSTYAVVAQKGLRNTPVRGRGISDQMPDFIFNEITIYRPDALSGIYQDSPAAYVVMDRNLGATSAGTVCDTGSNVGTCGFLYQFGNNYGFSYGNIDMIEKYTGESVDLTLYSPSNPYYDSRFIYGNTTCSGTCDNRYWAVVPNDSIWGGKDGDYIDRQGPCPNGWYVPTKKEWLEAVDYWTVGESNQGTGQLNYHNINAFRNYFQLPLGGERTRTDGIIAQVGSQGNYFTTEPNNGNPYILRITTSNGIVNSNSTYNLVNGYSVRCFKNVNLDTYYTVTYNDGVEGEEIFPDQTDSVIFGSNYPEFTGSLEREGYEFLGWTESTGSDVIFDIENNRVIADITLYAKWRLICPDGEDVGPDDQCHTEAEIQRLNQIVVDLDLYYLVSDGSVENKQYTIMDRNMGATSVYNKNYASPNNDSKGYLYQRGNNYGFPSTGNNLPGSVLTTGNKVPKSIWEDYVPSRYASKLYYKSSEEHGNWMADSTISDGIWGGTGDTYLANGGGTTLEGRQGPCPSGYHVPSSVEWQNLFDLYPGDETSSDLNNFTNDLLIPPVGRRSKNGALANAKALSYWSSSPSTDFTRAMGFYWEQGKIIERYQSDGRARARSVRCFKNTGSEFVSKENIHLNGGTDVFISIHSGTILSLGTPTLTSAQLEQATFNGWYTTSDFSGNPLSTGNTVSPGSSLYAKFTCNESGYIWNGSGCEDGVRLYFDSMGGTEVSSQLIKSGTTGVRPEDPTKTGYVFSGWFLTGASEEFVFTGTIITGETTVYAHWNTGQYEVSITSSNDDYGTVDSDSVIADYLTPISTSGNELTIGSTTVTATPTTGDVQYTYTFSGWNNTCGDILTGDCTITANFDRVSNVFTATIIASPEGYGTVNSGLVVANHGSSISENENTLTIGSTTVVATPATGGVQYTYIFSGWNNTCGDILTGDCTIIANFDREVNKYDVTFDSTGGNYTPATQNVEYGSTATKPIPDPTKTGYEFSGWTLNGLDFDFSTPIIGTTNLVAKWNLVEYTITYNLDGGINDPNNPDTYTIESGAITLQQPTKTGYIFLGWTGSNGDVAQTGVIIPSGSDGNKVYNAVWQSSSTQYMVYHYVKKIGESTYTLAETETGHGETDAILVLSGLAKNEYPCASYDRGSLTGTENGPGEIVTQTTIKGDGSTKIYLYYNRNSYTVHLSGDAGIQRFEIDGEERIEAVRECGSEVPVNAIPKPGYHFLRWDRLEGFEIEGGSEISG